MNPASKLRQRHPAAARPMFGEERRDSALRGKHVMLHRSRPLAS